MKQKLLYKLLWIQFFVGTLVVVGIGFGIRQYSVQLIEQNRMMAYQNYLMFRAATEHYILITYAIVIPLALLLSWGLTRAIVKPLFKMRKLTEQIAKGNYQIQLDIHSRDEIGELADSFNQMSQELARIEELRHHLVADVAHELRTPLSTIRGYMEAMKDGVLPPSPALIERSYQEVERLVRLVDDLHELSRIDGERSQPFVGEATDMREVIEEVSSNYELKWQQKGLQFQKNDFSVLPKGVWWVQMERNRAVQLWVNLFENALRYTLTGGQVFLSARMEDQKLALRLRNTGEIPPESLPFLFERFYRVESSRAQDQGGTGIGLAIVHELVTRASGQIQVSCEQGFVTFELFF